MKPLSHILTAAAFAVTFSSLTFAADTHPTTKPVMTKVAPQAADKPAPKTDAKGEIQSSFLKRHEEYVALAKKGGVDLYFEGDSITDGWHSKGKEVWAKAFAGWNAANFGIGGDRTQHILWRLDNGELDGVKPKVFVLMIGTNNLGSNTNEQIIAGNEAIIKKFQHADPDAKILLLGIFPRIKSHTDRTLNPRIKEINVGLAKLADDKNVKFLDFGDKFVAPDGTITKEMMTDGLHPNAPGYEIWAAAMKPILTEWLGAPKESDLKTKAEDQAKDQIKNRAKNNMQLKKLPGNIPLH